MNLLKKLFSGEKKNQEDELINKVTVVCGKCNHEYNMQLDSNGNHTFGYCPKCNNPVSSQYDQKGKKFSPAQSAAEAIIKKYT